MTSLLDHLPKTRMPTLVTGQQHDEWRNLRDAWKRADANNERDSTWKTAEAEQQAYDSWCDWVEENNLNYSPYDPRGLTDPSEQDDAEDWAKTLMRGDQIVIASRPSGRRWTVVEVTDNGKQITVFRRSSEQRFQRKHVTGDQLVTAMKANTHA